MHFINNTGITFVQEIISWAQEERDWNFHYKCCTVSWTYTNAWWFMVCFFIGLLDLFESICYFLFRIKHDKDFCCRYGSWGICFIYATWFALVGLTAAGKTYYNCKAVCRGVEFLLKTQNNDGGWGESYLSSPNKVISFATSSFLICWIVQIIFVFYSHY